ncbi:Rft protein-domain-containing protein [Kickxella alabastrina]|uniref:Rft protein-domain-containing protein n=1 Tax=Kickxella alabastrina TaxID=61397 RepID=UPI002220DC93|nr:Rft protein-domain-containing protein [Kickxella alabastrina]KAI7834678.1 Rft protein-domain-containing protein [Kickxella alabastrina]
MSEERMSRARSTQAFGGAQHLMGLQLFVRLATFSTTAIVVHLAGYSAFGVASVQFELLLSTILFLSREGVRNAVLRIDQTDRGSSQPSDQEQRLINAALLPIPVGALLACALYAVYCGGEEAGVPYYGAAMAVYVVAAWVELCVEPLFVLARARVLFAVQARCEAVAVFVRCMAVALTLFLGRQGGDNRFRLLAFAVGQLAYALVILCAYSWMMAPRLGYALHRCYLPRRVPIDGQPPQLVGRRTGEIIGVFVGQSLLKHVLTQGDSMAMARFATNEDMGFFALVSSYASIPARVLFLPLEEAARAVFVRCEPSVALHVLATLARGQLLLGCLLLVFGTLYAPVLLPLVGQDAAVARVLAAYCAYLPLLGLNGFLEAFVHSVASRGQLVWVNIWMAVCSVIYVAVAVLMLTRWRMGALGMVLANMLNMALRIVYCCHFACTWLVQKQMQLPRVWDLVPNPAVLLACLTAGSLSAATIGYIEPVSALTRLVTLAAGGVLGLGVLAVIWRCERTFISAALALRSPAKVKTN